MNVSDLITTDDIISWQSGDVITITAGTGAGKSYFIKNKLYDYAKRNGYKILLLVHRLNCKYQFEKEIEREKKSDVIHIKTYQSLEAQAMKGLVNEFGQYHFIVCDEFHYFMSDAAFNIKTDMSFNDILTQKDKVRIYMSATGDYVERYIKHKKGIKIIPYRLPSNYDHINELWFFYNDTVLEEYLKRAIESNMKSIFFIQSAQKAYQLHKKFEQETLFNCGKSDEHYKYVDKGLINQMLKNERFEKLILITTTTMDTGVSLFDDDLQHIVCDIRDVGTLIQCIGRKRLRSKEEKIKLHIKAYTNQQLGGLKRQISKRINKADFLMNEENTIKSYISKFKRSNDYHNIVYDAIVDEDDKGTKKVNEMMYFKCMTDLSEINQMLDRGKSGYCNYIAYDVLGVDGYYVQDEIDCNQELEKYLDSITGQVMLTLKDREELIHQMNVKQDGKILRSLESLNAALVERNFLYSIRKFETSRIVNGKKINYKNAWQVYKLIN